MNDSKQNLDNSTNQNNSMLSERELDRIKTVERENEVLKKQLLQ